MHTLTCDSVLCVCVCSRAKGSGTGGDTCRERFTVVSTRVHRDNNHTLVHIHPCTNTATHIHMHAHAHTHTCLQTHPHCITQSHHLWIAFDSHHNGTERPQRIHSAFLLKAIMENLVLHCGIFSSCNGSLVTSTNNILVEKFHDNLLCLHFLNEPLTKLFQYLISCKEREDSWYTNLQHLMFTVGPPLTTDLVQKRGIPNQLLGDYYRKNTQCTRVPHVLMSLVHNAQWLWSHVRAHRVVLRNRQALTTLERLPVLAVVLIPHCPHSQ